MNEKYYEVTFWEKDGILTILERDEKSVKGMLNGIYFTVGDEGETGYVAIRSSLQECYSALKKSITKEIKLKQSEIKKLQKSIKKIEKEEIENG